MRGTDTLQESLFTVSKLEDFVPSDHPLCPIRELVKEALGRLNGLFNAIYADTGPLPHKPSSQFKPDQPFRCVLTSGLGGAGTVPSAGYNAIGYPPVLWITL